MKPTYCPDCSLKLVERCVNNKVILLCTNCGKIFIKDADRYRFIFQTSGNNTTREILHTLKED